MFLRKQMDFKTLSLNTNSHLNCEGTLNNFISHTSHVAFPSFFLVLIYVSTGPTLSCLKSDTTSYREGISPRVWESSHCLANGAASQWESPLFAQQVKLCMKTDILKAPGQPGVSVGSRHPVMISPETPFRTQMLITKGRSYRYNPAEKKKNHSIEKHFYPGFYPR